MVIEKRTELTPDIIRLIRQARGESTEEFASEIGVAIRTLQKWEAGDSQPTSDNYEAILESVPDEVDDLSAETVEGVLWDRKLPPEEERLYGSPKLQQLRERPSTSAEVDGLGSFTQTQRELVERLTVTGGQGGTKRMGDVETVLYLVGDDRRAVRRFIEVNEEFVADALSTRSNKLSSEWDEFRYALIQDEWRFYLSEELY